MLGSTVCCLGAEDVGALTCMAIAIKCPEIRVTIVDKPEVISDVLEKPVNACDPELQDMLKKCRHRNLHYTSNYATTIKDSDVIFVSTKIPTKSDKSYDLKHVEEITKMIATYAESDKVIVEKSMVPAKVAERIAVVLQTSCEPGVRIEVLSNPEFLTRNFTIKEALYARQMVIGSSVTPSGKTASECLSNMYERWMPRKNIINVSLAVAEDIKMLGITLLTQHLYAILGQQRICELTGIHWEEAKKFIGIDLDQNFHGNLSNLMMVCEWMRLPSVSTYVQSFRDLRRMQRSLEKFKMIPGKKIAVLGLTSDVNESKSDIVSAVEICKWLTIPQEKNVWVYDKKMTKREIINLLKSENFEADGRVVVSDDLFEATADAGAIIFFSELRNITEVQYKQIYQQMEPPKVVMGEFSLEEEEMFQRIGFACQNFRAINADGSNELATEAR